MRPAENDPGLVFRLAIRDNRCTRPSPWQLPNGGIMHLKEARSKDGTFRLGKSGLSFPVLNSMLEKSDDGPPVNLPLPADAPEISLR